MPQTLLAIEASEQACSVALSYQGRTLEHFEIAARRHSERLLPMVDKVLAEADIGLAQVDGLVFSRGPGAFTGIRIACSLVQGLAFSCAKPVLPLSTLQALAWQAANEFGQARIAPALDARMGEIYFGLYQVETDSVQTLHEDVVLPPETLQAMDLPSGPFCGVGGGWVYETLLREALGEINLVQPDYPLRATSLLALAELPQMNSKWVNAQDALPVYLRDQVAWKKAPPLA